MCRADLLLDIGDELLGLGDQLGLRRALELAPEAACNRLYLMRSLYGTPHTGLEP